MDSSAHRLEHFALVGRWTMSDRLKNKIAIVTGAGRGIGAVGFQMRNMLERTAENLAPPDVMVNNTGLNVFANLLPIDSRAGKALLGCLEGVWIVVMLSSLFCGEEGSIIDVA